MCCGVHLITKNGFHNLALPPGAFNADWTTSVFFLFVVLFLATSTAVCLKMNDHAEEPGGGPLRTTRNAQKKDTESPRMNMAQSMYISTEAAKVIHDLRFSS